MIDPNLDPRDFTVSAQARFERGLYPTLAAFGLALVGLLWYLS